MVKCKSWKVLTILFKIFLGISASTHWVVTENGKIQSQLDSMFHMRRPYDLLSLLEQERRASEIDRLYHEMVRRKASIDEEWAGLESATDLETRLYTTDTDCLRAGRPLSDVDLYTSIGDDGLGREGISLDELSPVEVVDDVPEHPQCWDHLDLDFTMRTFPHLQVLSWNLTSEPEVLSDMQSLLERTGQQIAAGLSRNATSWFLHNMASLYWRGRGDALKALHCAKRAVFLSPRQYRDIALLNLGCLIHQARCPAEAAIVLHAAVDHAPHRAPSHFALANVYAILGDYNRSIACYDNALKLRPHWSVAQRNRFAVLCHHKLENSLYQLHRSLQGILTQLHDYHSLQEQWLKHQEQLMYQQAPLEVKLQGYQHEPLTALLSHRGGKCVPQTQDGGTVLSCDSRMMSHHLQIDVTLSLQMLLKNVESQAKKISEQMSRRLLSPSGKGVESMSNENIGEDDQKTEADEADGDPDDGDGGLEIFVEPMDDSFTQEKMTSEVEEGIEDTIVEEVEDMTAEEVEQSSKVFLPYKHPKLNSLKNIGTKFKDSVLGFIEDLMKSNKIDGQMLIPEQSCQASNFNTDGCSEDFHQWLNPNSVEDEARQMKILPIAQSLGIVKEGSWLQNTSSHVLATLIITCIQLSQWDSTEVSSTKESPECSSEPGVLSDLSADSLRVSGPEPRLTSVFHSLLLEEHRPASLASFSSHLAHALKDKSRHEPSSAWLLETAAALYWRCVGDGEQMVSCLRAAVHKAPPDLKDIPLHHVAHILLTLGHCQEALVLASLALKVSPRSINAHMVLFHTYLALGQPENAMKYGKASITLYQQTQSSSP